MYKKDFVRTIAEKTGGTLKGTNETVDVILETIEEILAAGDEVKLSGFGNFSVTERAAREGHNPQTGEVIQIPAKKAVKFKPSSTLKEAINA